jgi:hypothetical protein
MALYYDLPVFKKLKVAVLADERSKFLEAPLPAKTNCNRLLVTVTFPLDGEPSSLNSDQGLVLQSMVPSDPL